MIEVLFSVGIGAFGLASSYRRLVHVVREVGWDHYVKPFLGAAPLERCGRRWVGAHERGERPRFGPSGVAGCARAVGGCS